MKTAEGFRPRHCPSWARAAGHRRWAAGDPLGSTRTLLTQRGRCNRLNSSNLQAFTRARVSDAGVCCLGCWTLPCPSHAD